MHPEIFYFIKNYQNQQDIDENSQAEIDHSKDNKEEAHQAQIKIKFITQTGQDTGNQSILFQLIEFHVHDRDLNDHIYFILPYFMRKQSGQRLIMD